MDRDIVRCRRPVAVGSEIAIGGNALGPRGRAVIPGPRQGMARGGKPWRES
jgi:hypothetical protein